MGRRKFKLETRKNAERKKYSQKQREEVKLVVSVPRLVYLSTPAPDIHVLYRRLTCSDITSGWSCNETPSTIVISKLFEEYTVSLSIQHDFHFFIEMGDNCFRNMKYFQSHEVVSVSSICNLLRKLDDTTLCIGNPDDKFAKTNEQHSGQFKDKTGISI